MRKYLILTVIGIVVLGGALYILLHLNKNVPAPTPEDLASNPPATTTANTVTTYKNGTYGYSLEHPSALKEKTYGQNDVVFGGIAEAQVMIVQGGPGETFGQAAARELKNLCAADGPTTTFSCTAVEKIQPYPSASGAIGLQFYLRGELMALKTKKITVIEKGPYFAFPIQSGATGSSVLVIHPPLNLSAAEAATTTIEAIAKSVRFDAPQQGNVELQAYISQHLAQLSSVKAQLGGTFFVTSIQAKDGKGTVNYEDGHNAYIADFTYSTDTAGKMTVMTFKVRK